MLVVSAPAWAVNKDAEENIRLIKAVAEQVGVEAAICLAIVKTENSRFSTTAFNDNKIGRGHADIRQSHGLFQLTYVTGKSFGIKKRGDLYDKKKNAVAAIKFIKYLLNKYPHSSLADIAQRYNLGETRFRRGATAQAYAKRFMMYYHGYRATPGGAIR
jgi:hypothetical protein